LDAAVIHQKTRIEVNHLTRLPSCRTPDGPKRNRSLRDPTHTPSCTEEVRRRPTHSRLAETTVTSSGAEHAAYLGELPACTSSRGARARAHLDEGDRAAGLALTIQIVARESSRAGPRDECSPVRADGSISAAAIAAALVLANECPSANESDSRTPRVTDSELSGLKYCRRGKAGLGSAGIGADLTAVSAGFSGGTRSSVLTRPHRRE
jgi:hypothetical protein